jgi:hypothetical protein
MFSVRVETFETRCAAPSFKIFRASIENEMRKNVRGAINVDHMPTDKKQVFSLKT